MDAYFFCQRLQPIDFGFILSNGGPQSLTNNYKLQKKKNWKLKVCNDLFGSKTWRDVKRGHA